MKIGFRIFFPLLVTFLFLKDGNLFARPFRVLVITGGHGYQEKEFNDMLASLGDNYTYTIESFPGAYHKFRSEDRSEYDVLLFYHMWQKITEHEADNLAETIREGKPLVVLHHSICAFDDWPEYWNITGGKYFHKATVLNGKEYPACSYKHDLRFTLKVVDPKHPVTRGLKDFEVLDESYLGYYVDPEVTPLLKTDEPSSTPVVGWTKKYGKAQVVTLQSGHDANTFGNPDFRRLLKQSIRWVVKESK
jgi:type 1 glutamine amidotransferase